MIRIFKATADYWERRYREAERHLGLLMSPDEKKNIYQSARAYAGGKAKAKKMKMNMDNMMMNMDVQKDDGGAPAGSPTPAGGLTPGDVHVDIPLGEEKGRKKRKVSIMTNTNIVKSDDDQRLVTGIVLEPYTVDSQGDWETPEEIEKAAHKFMALYRGMGVEHVVKNERIFPVESYIAPTDLVFDYGNGEERVVKSGSWLMTSKILDDAAWSDVKEGLLTGYSVEGRGERPSDPTKDEIDTWYLTGNIEKRNIPQSERDKMDSADFAGKGTSFPIKTQADVNAAFHSLGRAGSDNYSEDEIRANIIRIARRKGLSLPKSVA